MGSLSLARSLARSLVIMQPYFLPYIGYWQLMRAAECFVIYDDVNYIKSGWINRNRILINRAPAYFTLPLQQASSNRRICDIGLQPSEVWRDKLVKTLELTYRQAPCFPEVFPVLAAIIRHRTDSLGEFLAHQLQTLAAFMGLATQFILASKCHQKDSLDGQARVINICRREGATVYINPQGGQGLYDASAFYQQGIDLRFLVMQPIPYPQASREFLPYLSIVDALMAVGPVAIKTHLDAYRLIRPGLFNDIGNLHHA